VGHTDRQLACPGISNWNRLYPNFDDAIANLEGFLDAARKKGVMGFAITAWGDDGSECLFSFLDPLILIGMEAAESGSTSKWTEKWIRIAGEPREVVQARMVLGRREVADNLKKSLYRHEVTPSQSAPQIDLPETIERIPLPEDLHFIRECVRVASKTREEAHPSDYIALANTYAKLWLAERKPQGLKRVLTKLWGSAAAVELKL